MANIMGALGAASTIGGLAANLLGGNKKVKGGTHHPWVNDVTTHIGKHGIQRDNLGLIQCPMPSIINKRYKFGQKDFMGITRRTEGFNVPGTSIQTTDIRRYGVGPVSRMPVGNVNTNTVTIQFVADQEGLYYKFFLAWMDSIVSCMGRSKRAINKANDFAAYFYEVEYHEDYAVDITLTEMSQSFDSIIDTVLIGAFPISIQDKQLNWNNSGLVVFTVEFAFMASDVDVSVIGKGFPNRNIKPNRNIMGMVMKGINTVQLLSSMKKSGGLKSAAGLIGVGATALSIFR